MYKNAVNNVQMSHTAFEVMPFQNAKLQYTYGKQQSNASEMKLTSTETCKYTQQLSAFDTIFARNNTLGKQKSQAFQAYTRAWALLWSQAYT